MSCYYSLANMVSLTKVKALNRACGSDKSLDVYGPAAGVGAGVAAGVAKWQRSPKHQSWFERGSAGGGERGRL